MSTDAGNPIPLVPPAHPTPARAWFYAAGAHRAGPLDTSLFRKAIEDGFVRHSTPVWTAGFSAWVPAGQVPQLGALLAEAHARLGDAPPVQPAPLVSAQPDYRNDAARWLIPVGRSGYAVAAGYFGLFSLLLFPAPFALLFGILALRQFKREPHLLGRGRAWFGIIAGALAFVLGVLALIAAIND